MQKILRIFNVDKSHHAWCAALMAICVLFSVQNVNANYYVDSGASLRYSSTQCTDGYGAAIHFAIAATLVVTGTISVKQALLWTGVSALVAAGAGIAWYLTSDDDDDEASAEASSESSSDATQSIHVDVQVEVNTDDSGDSENPEEIGGGPGNGSDSTSLSSEGPRIAHCKLVFTCGDHGEWRSENSH